MERPGRLRGRELLLAVAEGTASSVGDEFLRSLVRHIAEALSAKMVMVTEASDPEGRHVRMLAGWYDGAPIDFEVSYETRGQPCALVPGESVVAYPQDLAKHFPEDQSAIELGLESYFAVCLRDSQDVYLGHLAVLDTERMTAGQDDVAALRIFAARAGAELERRNQAAALAESRARVIEAADAERRRVGRDLHDGAQQRLLAVSNLLRVARKKPDGADELLAMAADELTAAHAELRELARGLHPVALADRGLPAAIESLTSVSTVPVELAVCDEAAARPDRRGRLLRRRRVPHQRLALRQGGLSAGLRLTRRRAARDRGRRRRGRRRRPDLRHGPPRPRRPRRAARRPARGPQPSR